MITKEQLLAIASELGLLPTTVNKDYALGWLLHGIGQHPVLSNWAFKGGTCLKKAYFDTYRFSEDLDFTVPQGEPYTHDLILRSLKETTDATYEASGVEFLKDEIQVKESLNKRQKQTFVIRIPFQGPLRQNNKSIQRITFDVTQDEILVAAPELRTIFHGYPDAPTQSTKIQCYTVNELIAEKTRALYERQGRSRDVYDIVNISRNFRDDIDTQEARRILREKFKFKELPEPTVDTILSRLDLELLRQSWRDQLEHQLPILPLVDYFIADLKESLKWWVEGDQLAQLPAVATAAGEALVPRERFSALPVVLGRVLEKSGTIVNNIRFAARNQVCVEITYGGISRLVEPYSLRRPKSGNLLLYAYELLKGNTPSESIKAFQLAEIQNSRLTNTSFRPRFQIEL